MNFSSRMREIRLGGLRRRGRAAGQPAGNELSRIACTPPWWPACRGRSAMVPVSDSETNVFSAASCLPVAVNQVVQAAISLAVSLFFSRRCSKENAWAEAPGLSAMFSRTCGRARRRAGTAGHCRASCAAMPTASRRSRTWDLGSVAS